MPPSRSRTQTPRLVLGLGIGLTLPLPLPLIDCAGQSRVRGGELPLPLPLPLGGRRGLSGWVGLPPRHAHPAGRPPARLLYVLRGRGGHRPIRARLLVSSQEELPDVSSCQGRTPTRHGQTPLVPRRDVSDTYVLSSLRSRGRARLRYGLRARSRTGRDR